MCTRLHIGPLFCICHVFLAPPCWVHRGTPGFSSHGFLLDGYNSTLPGCRGHDFRENPQLPCKCTLGEAAVFCLLRCRGRGPKTAHSVPAEHWPREVTGPQSWELPRAWFAGLTEGPADSCRR